MVKTLKLTLFLFLLQFATAMAQKTVYIPNEWKNFNPSDTLLYAESDPNNKYTWSLSRSKESDNVIVLWDKYYGNTSPSNAPSTYKVDIDDLLAKCETFFQLEYNTLGFSASNLDKYKVMVLLNHSTVWICVGSGYDYQVSALWLAPSACNPVGSAVAHEVGHSFHYMCYCEDSNFGALSNVQTGFHGAVGKGATIWETTANWQSLQSYPSEYFTMSYMSSIFPKSHNYAFSHEWQRYQTFPFLQYLCEYYNDITTVAQVWKQHETSIKDFNQVLMDNKGLSVEELYKLHFNFAMHAVTWDFDFVKDMKKSAYIGQFNYNYVKIANKKYQVAMSSCPQSTGFNVIPLQVPAAGTQITTHFTALATNCALADGDPAEYLDGDSKYVSSGRKTYTQVSVANKSKRAFRLGYVALMKDGTTQYYDVDQLYCKGTASTTEDFSYIVPEGVSRLWLVVSPCPTAYIQHKWDDLITTDDMWPYQVAFSGTDLKGEKDVVLSKDKLNINSEGITDLSAITDLTTAFTLENKTVETYMYFTDSKEVANYGSLYTAQNPATNGYLFKLEKPKSISGIDGNDYVLKVYNGNMKTYTNWDGNSNCLNFNADGSITFCLGNGSNNGRDMTNGGAWDITYDETNKAFTLKNIALKKYLTTGVASSTPDYWTIKTTFLSYDPHDVNVVYETIKDAKMDPDIKAAMEAARAAYLADPTPENLTAYGDAVLAAQKSAEEYATGIEEIQGSKGLKGSNASNASGVYNLNGQHVSDPSNGLYIINGKKTLFE